MTAEVSGRVARDELVALIERGEVDTVILAVTDMQGRLQGKRIDAEFFVESLANGVAEGCSYLLASDVDMRTVDGFALTSWDRGYGDVAFRPDFSTVRYVPWHDRTVIVFADVQSVEGQSVAVSPRQVLRGQSDRLAQRGWTGFAGTELEFIVFRDSYESAWR